MKACHPILFVLFAVAAGEALPPDAVPVMCAAICGPIVELSSMCSPKRSLGGLESDRLDLRARPRLAKRCWGKQLGERHHRHHHDHEDYYSAVEPEQTTLSPDLVAGQYFPTSSSSETSISPSQSPASVAPLNYSPPSQPPPVPAPVVPTTPNYIPPSTSQPAAQSATPPTTQSVPPASTSTTQSEKSQPTTSSHQTSTLPTIIGSTGDSNGMTGGWVETEDAEEQCVCENTSFNVAEIAGLCASCISMKADTQNNMQVIMSVCGFPPQKYNPSNDSLANNILVMATRPTAANKLNGAIRSAQPLGGMILGAAIFAVGAIMML